MNADAMLNVVDSRRFFQLEHTPSFGGCFNKKILIIDDVCVDILV